MFVVERFYASAKTKTAAKISRPLFQQKINLVQPEADFHVDLHCHRLSVFHGGLKLPGLDRFDGLLVQPQAQAAGHANVSRPAIRSYHQPEHAGPLILRLAGFFRILRIGLIHNSRRADTAAYAEHSTADAATTSLTHARTGANAHTAT